MNNNEMHYEGTVIRPPNEADSILLQVSIGCSHNKCSFCGAYTGHRFAFKSMQQIEADLDFAKQYCTRQRKLFLVGGDALVLPQDRLLTILAMIRKNLPWVNRVSTYASAKAIRHKTDSQLQELRAAGVRLFHLGVESGDRETLARMNKNGTPDDIAHQALRAKKAGLKLFVTVLLGLGGQHRSKEHATSTAAILSKINPEYAAALTLMPVQGTPLSEWIEKGDFLLPDARGMLLELRTIIEETEMNGQFFANHASNHLPIHTRLPRGKKDILYLVDCAISGKVPLKSETMRRL